MPYSRSGPVLVPSSTTRAECQASTLHPRRGHRPMTARMHWASARWGLCSFAAFLPLVAGCQGIGDRHREKKIPQYGIIDPHQPRELEMVSMPPHVVEPPDELEVSVRPA